MTHLLSAHQAILLVILFAPYLRTSLSHSPRAVRKWGTKPNFCALLVSFVFCIELVFVIFVELFYGKHGSEKTLRQRQLQKQRQRQGRQQLTNKVASTAV